MVCGEGAICDCGVVGRGEVILLSDVFVSPMVSARAGRGSSCVSVCWEERVEMVEREGMAWTTCKGGAIYADFGDCVVGEEVMGRARAVVESVGFGCWERWSRCRASFAPAGEEEERFGGVMAARRAYT